MRGRLRDAWDAAIVIGVSVGLLVFAGMAAARLLPLALP